MYGVIKKKYKKITFSYNMSNSFQLDININIYNY